MSCIWRVMTDQLRWHEALELIPVTIDESSTSRKRHKSWQSRITHTQIAEKDDIIRRRERNKVRMRQVRAFENEDEAKRRREKNRLRMRQVRALESEVEAERRRERNKLRMRQIRAVEKIDAEKNLEFTMTELSVIPAGEGINNDNCSEGTSSAVEIKQAPEDLTVVSSILEEPIV